jgi:hypothetical protein
MFAIIRCRFSFFQSGIEKYKPEDTQNYNLPVIRMGVKLGPLGRPRRRWEDNIKKDLQEVGGGRGDWMEL